MRPATIVIGDVLDLPGEGLQNRSPADVSAHWWMPTSAFGQSSPSEARAASLEVL
jgi:hypothetical protein